MFENPFEAKALELFKNNNFVVLKLLRNQGKSTIIKKYNKILNESKKKTLFFSRDVQVNSEYCYSVNNSMELETKISDNTYDVIFVDNIHRCRNKNEITFKLKKCKNTKIIMTSIENRILCSDCLRFVCSCTNNTNLLYHAFNKKLF